MAVVTYFVRMIAVEGKAEEVKETLRLNFSNIQNTEDGKGNIVFALHQSTENPNEFWVYETWQDADSVNTHESSELFKAYKTKIYPLVEGSSVLFGNCEPFAVKGYEV